MSEERGYPGVQLGTFITGDQFVFRAETGDELKEILTGVAENADDTIKALNALKQAGVANGIMTGNSQQGGKAPVTKASDSGGERKPDSPPPTGEAPTCGCGVPMLDLADKNYKNRWYADKDKCKTNGKDKACWAKK